LKNADLALYRAKEDGRNMFRFLEPAMDAALQKRRRLESDLRNALRKNQLYLDYQPQFGLDNGKLTGYEALVRWWHPSEGEIPPTTFIPIADETGFIVLLVEWILKTACAVPRPGHSTPNSRLICRPPSSRPKTSIRSWAAFSLRPGLSPTGWSSISPKASSCQNTEAVMETLTKLDQLGVSISMDDFGTAIRAFSYLTRFPVKKIKIERSFIDTLGTSPQTSAIVSSIVGLGQSQHVTITAEGVETEGQAAMSRNGAATKCRATIMGEVPEDGADDTPLDRPLVA